MEELPESLKTVKVTAATGIDAEAFKNCSDIENIILPDTLEEMGEMVFYGCASLKSVNISGLVTEISKGAFIGCENLKITVPSAVTAINREAFKNCTNLKITLSEGLLYIGCIAFHNCTYLKDFIFEGTRKEWEAIEKEKGWDNYVGRGEYTVHCSDDAE